MQNPETLTAGAVLLTLILAMGSAWIRDRNARIKDLKERIKDLKDQIVTWRETVHETEKSREADREISRQMLDAMRTSEAVIAGLRNAFERREREDS